MDYEAIFKSVIINGLAFGIFLDVIWRATKVTT